MKQPYESPTFHLLPGIPGRTGDELAAMDDAELEKLLIENGFLQHKKLYRANPDFLLRVIAGEPLLMPTGSALSGMMLPLSETASFIMRQLETPKTVQDIIAAAQAEYADAENTLEANIRDFIEKHTKTGLILEEE